MMKVARLPLPFDLSLDLPGSKSHANRAIVAAALAAGETFLKGATPCEDVSLLAGNLQRMGFDLKWLPSARDCLRIRGGLPEAAPGAPVELHCGNAGTTLRFLTSVACLVPGDWIVTGSGRMCRRPIAELAAALRSLGAKVEDRSGCPPLRIRGGALRGGEASLDASRSSQFLSSLLLVGPALPAGLRVSLAGPPTSPTYVALTEAVLRDFGAVSHRRENQFEVEGRPYAAPGDYSVEGDWSAAGAYFVLEALTGSRFRGTNLVASPGQGDQEVPALLRSLGLEGDRSVDCTSMPDQLMNLAVFAAFRHGTTTFRGAANLRHKECDRLAVITEQLGRAGVKITETPDGVVVRGPTVPSPAVLDPHDDHRMAMAFAVLGAVAAGIEIRNPDCVRKSYPEFFNDFGRLGRSPRCIAVVGMRGAGKSTFAADLAQELGLDLVDTDERFTSRHGEIGPFVAANGWPAFRGLEEQIVAESLAAGRVVALGGGALESERTRKRLDAVVVYLEEPASTLIERLQQGSRPALTGLDPEQELRAVLARREPIFRAASTITVPPGLTREQRVAYVTGRLRSLCLKQEEESA
ncbi:MAG: 3-phosphoshikimate 1-carboxyvinyltransferase [Planctomycetota bacterium]